MLDGHAWHRGGDGAMVVAQGVRSSVFVGRRRERELLVGLVEAVASRGGAAVVLGELGVGKTALLDEVARRAPRTMWVRGVEAEAVLAYAAVADLLLPLREHFEKLPPVQRDALAVALTLRQGTLTSALAVCAGALGVLAAAGDQEPLLVVVDDYQLLDPSSRTVLSFVARRLAAEHVVMLIAVRDDPQGPADLLDLPTLRLAGLAAPECHELLTARGREVSADELADIVDESSGNPLALLELFDGPLVEVPRGGVGRLPAEHSVARAWTAAVAELPEPTRVALFVVAAAWRRPAVTDIEAVLAELGSSLTDLKPAEHAGLLRTSPALTLRHPLLRPVLIDATPLGERIAAYRALAAHAEPCLRAWYLAAAATGPDEAVADALAVEAARARGRSAYQESARAWKRAAALAGSTGKRARLLLAAATDAQVGGSFEMAVSLCEDALRLDGDPCFTADVELVRGRADTWLGRLPQAAGELVRAGEAVSGCDPQRAARLYAEAAVPLAMANRHHDMVRAAQRGESLAAHGPPTLHNVTMSAVASTLRGDCGPARARLDIGDRLNAATDQPVTDQPADDPVWDLQFRALLANGRVWLEDFDIARAQLGAMLERARKSGAASVLALALVAHSELDRWTGNWLAAYADATEALHWAEELRQVAILGTALTALARIDAARGEIALCDDRLDRARRLAVTHGIDSLDVSVPGVIGFAALGVGEFALAAEHLEAAADAAIRGGLAAPNVVPFGGDLVEAHVRAGHLDHASDALRLLEEQAAATGLVHPTAAAARCRGIIADGPDVARTWFGRARAAHARCPMPFEQARTLLCEAETLRRMRRPAEARPLLRQARSIFVSLGALPWAARSERELAATGESGTAPADRRLDRLTPQEFQIARSVAEGASNSDTAAALFLSQKTVEAHLTRVYRKLGVRSRAELAGSFARGEVGGS